MQTFNNARAILRLAGVFFLTVWTVMRMFYYVKRGATQESRFELRRKWAEGLMRILKFEITFTGDFPQNEACLYVSNHRSSLDPLVIMSRIAACPIARASVRHWPVVGKGAAISGVIFVDMKKKESRVHTRTALLKELQKGNSVLIYPEGHTRVAPTTSTFHKGSFEQAAAGGFRVVPHVIEYQYKEDYWDHTDNFAVHFIKRFGKRVTPIQVVFGPPLSSDNSWTLLRNAQKWIDETILEVRKAWDKEV